MRIVECNALYRHYKGDFYFVTGEALHTETNEDMVVYQALYGDHELFVRPSDMFLSEVPESAGNPTGQKYRFMSKTELGKEMFYLENVKKDRDYWKERCLNIEFPNFIK